MPSVQKTVPDEDEIDTVLAPDVEFAGNLRTGRDLLVKGRVRGSLDCAEDLYIAAEGFVSAQVKARRIVVRGALHGKAVALESIEVLPGSKVTAVLEAPEVVVEDKDDFSGSILLVGNADHV